MGWIMIISLGIILICGVFAYASLDKGKSKSQSDWEEVVPVVGSLVSAMYRSNGEDAVSLLSPYFSDDSKDAFGKWVSANPLSTTTKLTLSPVASDVNGWTWAKLEGGNITLVLAFSKDAGSWGIIYIKLL